VASIVVDASSQNAIIIVAGANGRLEPESIRRFDGLLANADVIVCQLEVPMDTVGYTLLRARELGKIVVLNPAPACGPLPAHWYTLIDYLIPNESEATALTGIAVDSLESAESAANALRAAGAPNVIVTLGAQGSLLVGAQGARHYPAPQVTAVDTTAAGDTFVGGFCAALAQGRSEVQAMEFGQIAAALSVTRPGAQPSIPTSLEVKGFKPL
jgi:ribokinase